MNHLRREGHRSYQGAGFRASFVGAADALHREEYRFAALHDDAACAVFGYVPQKFRAALAGECLYLAFGRRFVVWGAVVAVEDGFPVVVEEYQGRYPYLREHRAVHVNIRIIRVSAGHEIPSLIGVGPVAGDSAEHALFALERQIGARKVPFHALSVRLVR